MRQRGLFATCAATGALAVGTLSVVALSAPVAAGAAPRLTRIATGVGMYRSTFTLTSGGHRYPERIVTLEISLSSHTTLEAETAHNLIAASRETVTTIGNRAHAVGGVNGDFFSTSTRVERGGVIRNGVTFKSPRHGTAASLYVTTDGKAAVGDVELVAELEAAGGVKRVIRSINALEDPGWDHLTLANSALTTTRLPSGCEVMHLANGTGATAGKTVIGEIEHSPEEFVKLPNGQHALVGCGESAQWMVRNLHRDQVVSTPWSYPVKHIQTLIGGGRVLIRGGVRYNDPNGMNLHPARNPLTFGCISRAGRTIQLGVVDGRSKISAGMTYGDLQNYLMRLHCYSAIALDGGGSSTLVAREPRHRSLSVENRPSEGHQRNVADGLFVLTR